MLPDVDTPVRPFLQRCVVSARAEAAALLVAGAVPTPLHDLGLGAPTRLDDGDVAFLSRPRVVSDLRRLSSAPPWLTAAGWRSMACLPTPGGVLVLASRRPNRLSRRTLATLASYADLLSASALLATAVPRQRDHDAAANGEAREVVPDGPDGDIAAALRATELRLSHLATHDALTGLGNRALLADRLAQALRRLERHPGLVVVVRCDLDDVQAVNTGLGHTVGDQLLVESAARLREAVRPEDTVVRLGGAEFVVVAEQLPDEAAGRQLADRVLHALREPIVLGATELYPRASAGVAVGPPATDADELLGNADLALLAAKQAGGGRVTPYDPQLRERGRGRVRLRADLHRALDRGQLAVHYQPMVELETHRVVGAEALVRWEHPELGTLLPGAFLPLADDGDLAVRIDEHVLDTACREVGDLARRTRRPLELWVDVCARTIASPSLRDVVRAVTRRHRLPARQLTLEIDEATLLHDPSGITHVLSAVRALGVGLAVDRFGTGHTALTYLTRLPVTAVKLDRSVVQDIDTDPIAEIVVSSVTGLARAIGLTTVAEGIANRDQLTLVTGAGCERGQGFVLGRPAPLADLAAAVERPMRRGPYAVT